MAGVGIDVVFTGLMLICLDGQPDCPKGSYADKYPNTAWIVKADGGGKTPRKVCGWYCGEQTRLELRFNEDNFPGWKAEVGKFGITCDGPDADKNVTCSLSALNICVEPDQYDKDLQELGLSSVLRLDEIDRRLVAPRKDRLEDYDYVSNRIHFRNGEATAGELWSDGDRPIRWYRSDESKDKALPRRLSDRLKVTHRRAKKLTLDDCSGSNLIVLETKKAGAEATFRNVTTHPPTPMYESDEDGGYDSLTYLLWYYRLAEWDTYKGECPDYGKTRKDPVLLRCVSKESGCAFKESKADTRFWPPVLGGPREE